jgi:hypothetical protein
MYVGYHVRIVRQVIVSRCPPVCQASSLHFHPRNLTLNAAVSSLFTEKGKFRYMFLSAKMQDKWYWW